MKKALLLSAMAISFMAFSANAAEMMQGKVLSKKGDRVVIQTDAGRQVNARVTQNTTYREKKVLKKDKVKDGVTYKAGSTYYKSPIEEDEFIEVYYTPSKDAPGEIIIEDVVMIDD